MTVDRKFTKTERAKVHLRIEELDSMGWTQRAIAAEVGVSQQRVCTVLKQIRQEYAAKTALTHTEKVERKRQQLAVVMREAFRVWSYLTGQMVESLAEKVTRRVEVMNRLKIPLPPNMTLAFDFAPDPQLLQVILKALLAEMKLDGLLAANQTNILQQQMVNIDWSGMLKNENDPPPENEIDRMLREYEATTPAMLEAQPKQLPCGLRELRPTRLTVIHNIAPGAPKQ